MNRGMQKEACACCGAPKLTQSEVAVVMCLFAFGGILQKKELARTAKVSSKTVWRVLDEKPELFDVQVGTGGKTRTTIGLSKLGKVLAVRIRGGTNWKESAE